MPGNRLICPRCRWPRPLALAFRWLERAFRWLDAQPLVIQIAVTCLLVTVFVTAFVVVVARVLRD
jgi:hypothetical protein